MTQIRSNIYPKILVVVPCFNEERYIEQCLASLAKQSYPRDKYEVIVVDNGSTDKSVAIAKRFADEVFIKLGGKVGGVRNFGVEQRESEIVAFIDADCVAPEHWLMSGYQGLVHGANVGAVGGNYLLKESPSWIESGWVLENYPKAGETKSLVGGSFFVSRELFDDIGGFDEKINAGEDTKLSGMINSRGLSVQFVEGCALVHMGYPESLSGFMKRQFWHASSYKNSQLGILKDKTFVAVVVFLMAILSSVLAIAMQDQSLFLVSLLGVFLPPLAFTFKRAWRVIGKVKYRVLLSAYALDLAYFAARSAGLITSFIYDPFKK